MLGLPMLVIIAVLLGAFWLNRKPRKYGSGEDMIERRHPDKNPEAALDETGELLRRRKDDNVGGESGA